MSAEAPEAMDVSSSDDSSDSEFEELDATPEDMELLMKLETDLQANPNLYDSHVQVQLDYSAGSGISIAHYDIPGSTAFWCCSTLIFCGNANSAESYAQQERPCNSSTHSQSSFGLSGFKMKLLQPKLVLKP